MLRKEEQRRIFLLRGSCINAARVMVAGGRSGTEDQQAGPQNTPALVDAIAVHISTSISIGPLERMSNYERSMKCRL